MENSTATNLTHNIINMHSINPRLWWRHSYVQLCWTGRDAEYCFSTPLPPKYVKFFLELPGKLRHEMQYKKHVFVLSIVTDTRNRSLYDASLYQAWLDISTMPMLFDEKAYYHCTLICWFNKRMTNCKSNNRTLYKQSRVFASILILARFCLSWIIYCAFNHSFVELTKKW